MRSCHILIYDASHFWYKNFVVLTIYDDIYFAHINKNMKLKNKALT